MNTIDEYIQQYPLELQEKMLKIRQIIHEEVPNIEERMSWQMPTFYYYGNLIHFAVAKHHIGIYPGESGVRVFENELNGYKHSKGTIQIPHTSEMPYDLIRRIVKYRQIENEEEYVKKHGTK